MQFSGQGSVRVIYKMPKKPYLFEFWATPKNIAQEKRLTLTEKAVLSSLITRHNGELRLKVKQETIAEDWGISVKSVNRAIKKLSKIGYVESLRIGKKLCNQYKIK